MKNSLTRSLIAIVMLCFIFCSPLDAQRGKHWHFGDRAGLVFNGAGTPTATNYSFMDTDEGCASISDVNGNLLFFTDGSTVYTSTGAVMANGTSLGGHTSSTQSAVIMPSPINPDVYLVYVLDAQCAGGSGNGIQMAFVDMSLNSGNGVVTSKNNPVFAGNLATEKISATCHTNNTDYWVVTQRRNTGQLYAWQVDGASSFAPVVSNGATTAGSCDSRVGQLKFSPDGTRLAVMDRGSSGDAILYDFDNSTGVVSNPRTIRSGVTYGCEFSPNSNLLYVTTFGRLYQYDATQTTTAGLQGSVVQIHQTNGGQLGSIQTGPNGRLYVSNGGPTATGDFVDEIQQPNVQGTGCTYMNDIISLINGTNCGLGLPNFTACFQPEPCDLGNAANIYLTQLSNCTFSFNAFIVGGGPNSSTQIVGHHWDFGDGNTSSDPSPTHIYTTPGYYSICHTVTGFNGVECCTKRYCIEGLRVDECDPCDELDASFGTQNANTTTPTFYVNSPHSQSGYYWDFGDGTSGVGTTPTHSYPVAGVYNVCLTEVLTLPNLGACCTRTNCSEIAIGGGADKKAESPVKEAAESGIPVGLKVYPNPAKHSATISFELGAAQNMSLEVLDLQGQVIQQLMEPGVQKKGLYEISVITETIPAGIYVVRLTSDKRTLTGRIAVVK